MAPGEKYSFYRGDKEDRNKLIEEILKNKDKMKDILNERNNDKNLKLKI